MLSVTQSKAISRPATPVSPTNPLDSESSGSTVAISESEDNVSISSASGLRKQFSIPNSWPPVIQACIDQKTDEARKLELVPTVRSELSVYYRMPCFALILTLKKNFALGWQNSL